MEKLVNVSNTLKFLSVDMINKANSGHPGVAMGLSDIVSVLMFEMNINPKNPNYINRDRLVFSGGHASALVYSYLHLCGYDLSLDELKNFRQIGSKTPGHPELFTNGVEIATGPLGQGVANAVGLAMAAKKLQQSVKELNHKVYCLCGDGDLQEGISYEACSLAALHNLDNLIIIYDSNKITIEGSTDIAFVDDIYKRFESVGFLVLEMDGHNHEQIKSTLDYAKDSKKPVLIIAHTKIAKGALELEGTSASHGAPLGVELTKKAKSVLNYPLDEFYIDESVKLLCSGIVEKGAMLEKEWNDNLSDESKKALDEFLNPKLDVNFVCFDKDMATRDSNNVCLNTLADNISSFLGGSADLGPSNKTELKNHKDFVNGKNIHFGIREHAMGAITNSFARYGFLPYCATFLSFFDYLKPAYRMSAIMGLKSFWVFTHDSISVGEDGPTHQPIEHLTHLRATPNSLTFRPADGNENFVCWEIALASDITSAFVLSRGKLPKLDLPLEVIKQGVKKGAYLVKNGNDATILASGSEVSIALNAAKLLEEKGKSVGVVSMPCFEIFDKQDNEYKKSILKGKVIGFEASSGLELYKYADEVICMSTFGESGKDKDVYKHFGLDEVSVSEKILNFL